MKQTQHKTFISYQAKTANGLVLVVNEGVNAAGDKLVKVMPMRLRGYAAEWDRTPRGEFEYSPARWIKASALVPE